MSEVEEPDLPPCERVGDLERIVREMNIAVREALRRHKRDGNPVAVWRDGRVIWIPPEEIPDGPVPGE